MQRRRFKRVLSFPDDIGQAERLRAEAEKMPPGPQGGLPSNARPGRPRPWRGSTNG
jgi:hypothetical protein